MSVKKITTWKTSDGTLFEDQSLADKFERDLNIRDAVATFWDKHGYSGISVYDIAATSIEHADELLAALKGEF